MLFFTGHCGFQAVVVGFSLLAGYGFRACTANGSDQVSAHLVFHIAGYIIEELAANGVGHVFGSVVGDILSLIGDRTVLSSVGDVRFCLFRTGQNMAVAILNFLENLLPVLGDVRFVGLFSILAGNYRARFAGGLGGYIGVIIFIRQCAL